jgi:hypothetical protein
MFPLTIFIPEKAVHHEETTFTKEKREGDDIWGRRGKSPGIVSRSLGLQQL